MTAPDRRQTIVDAALAAFVERGYLGTSISDIRRASGASTGSIYHFFDGKGALAEALLREAVAGWGAEAAMAADAGAEQAIKASVSGMIRWGLAHPGHARFTDEIRTLALAGGELAAVATLLAAGQAASERQYRTWTDAGEVRPLPWALAHSLMLGPAYNYLRLVGHDGGDKAAPALLAEAAWQAVRA